jgi:thiol:disulfide interchange protein DsbA
MQGAPLQRIYYTLLSMGKADALQAKVFDALQTQRLRLDQPQALFGWIAQQGLDRAKFEETYNSFGVATEMRRAVDLQNAYGVKGTPAMGVGGRYYIDGNMAQTFDRMLTIVNALVQRERQRMHQSS